jgi:hypothetical protein
MTTPSDFRGFAMDCMRWSKQSTDRAQAATLVDMARIWMQTACIVEDRAVLAADRPEFFRSLRAKLN